MKKKILFLGVGVGLIIGLIWQTYEGWGKINIYAEEMELGEEADEDDSDDETDLDEVDWDLPELYIKAINPGYKIDGINNVGEMIEIARGGGDPDAPISLAGTAVGYTNSSGNYSLLFEFPEQSWMTGESVLLRLASSPEVELANSSYKKTLAMNAEISLVVNGETIDAVCWTGKKGCYKAFNSANPTTLVRDIKTGEFEHQLTYIPEFKAENYFVEIINEEENKEIIVPKCREVQFSEILSYYESERAEQFIEFYNVGTNRVDLGGCKVRYKNKNYALGGIMEAEGYTAYYPVGFSLTKNPTNTNKLELVDTDGMIVDTLEYPNGQRKGTAYAHLGIDQSGDEVWRVTYAPTPGAPNNYQEYKTCEEGKIINKATGNCVKVTSVTDKICKDGYHLNILTGRCNKDTSTAEKTCKEGYYLNPETNRCRKIQNNTGADYNLKPENHEENSAFVALYAALGVLGAGGIYLIYEFRQEIVKLWRKVFRRFQ